MENYNYFIIAIVVLVGLYIIYNYNSNKYEQFRTPYGPYTPYQPNRWTNWFNWDNWSSWYNYSPYDHRKKINCIIPGRTNYNCVRNQLDNGITYRDAVRRCTTSPRLDPNCNFSY
jgi:hypothetical protein